MGYITPNAIKLTISINQIKEEWFHIKKHLLKLYHEN